MTLRFLVHSKHETPPNQSRPFFNRQLVFQSGSKAPPTLAWE